MRIEGLYVITDSALTGDRTVEAVEQALQGGARLVQYREKDRSAAAYRRNASEIRRATWRHSAGLIINDDPELAVAVDADGLHVGRADADIETARSVVGNHRVIGVSCYNDLDRARHAERRGADYVAFGSFYPSVTKPGAVRASLELLRRARRELHVPIVAIGGITADNGAALIDAGGDALAVINAVFGDDDIESAARRLANLFEPTMQRRST